VIDAQKALRKPPGERYHAGSDEPIKEDALRQDPCSGEHDYQENGEDQRGHALKEPVHPQNGDQCGCDDEGGQPYDLPPRCWTRLRPLPGPGYPRPDCMRMIDGGAHK
jgi:hypothetical protein